MHAALAFFLAHWGWFALLGYAALNGAVAVTPKRYQTEKWYGLALRLAAFLSTHLHWDQLGVLHIPLTGIALTVGGIPLKFGLVVPPSPAADTLRPPPRVAPLPPPPPGARIPMAIPRDEDRITTPPARPAMHRIDDED